MTTPPIQLMDHQRQAVERCAKNDRYGFWLDCGTGKTIAMLAAIDASKRVNASGMAADLADVFPDAVASVQCDTRSDGVREVNAPPYIKTVVVCPKAIIQNAWCRDAEHFPRLKVVSCWASTPAKRKALIETPDADVLVMNFEMFKKHRRDLYDANVRRLIVDESSKLKSHTTQITKAVIEFADFMESVYLLSGTPAPNSDTEYWSQFRCIDKRVFGDSFYRFAAEYFAPIKRDIKGKTVVIGHKPLPQKRSLFIKRMQTRSWSLRKADALDLPEQVDVFHDFNLSTAERAAYEQVETSLRAELNGESISVRAEGMVNKLRQLCGGWMYGKDKNAIGVGGSKLDALGDILVQIGREPAVVWIDYREDAQRIAALCEKRGETCEVLDGSTPGGNVRGIVDRFQAGEVSRLVCHPASVGHGITLTRSSYAVFFTPIWSAELYVQARDRIHRKGQVNRCTYYHLVADDTIEKGVLWACRNKRSKSEAIMQALSGNNKGAAA